MRPAIRGRTLGNRALGNRALGNRALGRALLALLLVGGAASTRALGNEEEAAQLGVADRQTSTRTLPELALPRPLAQVLGNEFSLVPVERNRPFADLPLRLHLANGKITSTFTRVFGDGWSTAAKVNAAAPSEKPLTQWKDVVVGVEAFHKSPTRRHVSWVFGVNWDDHRDKLATRAQVIWQANEQLRATFAVRYQTPDDRPSFDLTFEWMR